MSLPLPSNPLTTAALDFEGVFSSAVAKVYNQNGFQAFSLMDQVELELTRPRVEVIFALTGQAGFHRQQPTNLFDTWKGNLSLTCVTDVDAAGKQTHGSFRAGVRWIAMNLPVIMNGTYITNQKWQQVYEGATNWHKPTGGFETSELNYVVDFSMQTNAWTFNGSN